MVLIEKSVNSKVLVIGLGKSGYSVSKLLLQKGYQVWIYSDFIYLDEKKKILSLLDQGVKFFKQSQKLNDFKFVVKNPGIKYNHFLIKMVNRYKIPIYTEPYIAYRFFKGKIIALTGTNGKTTTSTLIYQFLKRKYNNNIYLVGNIGVPFSDIVNISNKKTVCILELSSFQILGMPKFKPYISIILNIEPDHLDFHKDYIEYRQTKLKIMYDIKNQDKHTIILNFDDALLNKINFSNVLFFSKNNFGNKIYSYTEKGNIYFQDKLILSYNMLSSSLKKNIDNCLAALLVAKLMNIDMTNIKNVLKNFKGIEHRLENIGEIYGRQVINDSKCTNMSSLEYALNNMNVPVVLMMGGSNKNNSFYSLVNFKNKIKMVISFGESAIKIRNLCVENNILCYNCINLRKAIDKAFSKSSNKDIILFSPACSSYDEFSNFEERGKYFKDYITKKGKL